MYLIIIKNIFNIFKKLKKLTEYNIIKEDPYESQVAELLIVQFKLII